MDALKPRTKRVPLDFMGEGWQECFVELRYLSWAESKAIDAQVQESGADAIEAEIVAIQRVFVAGKGLSAKDEVIELTKEHLASLDLEAIHTLYRAVLGIPDPKGLLS